MTTLQLYITEYRMDKDDTLLCQFGMRLISSFSIEHICQLNHKLCGNLIV